MTAKFSNILSKDPNYYLINKYKNYPNETLKYLAHNNKT